ncbi:MAG: biotin/lipoyl-containing protein [Clostridia bacterium]|nr:biotin/lipoyl-containing protein [Clostridia bacterium]MDO5302879.1 biotin/lipoyl-containing protein [Clostridia bacterium]
MEKYIVRVNGKEYEVEVEKVDGNNVATSGQTQSAASASAAASSAPAAKAKVAGTDVKSGTAGKVWKVVTKVGDEVKKGDSILILEAMKMEIPVVAVCDGKIADICVNEGDPVEGGQVVAVLA